METLPNASSAEQLLIRLRAEKLKLTQSHERLKPKLRSAKQELAVKNIASVPTGLYMCIKYTLAGDVSLHWFQNIRSCLMCLLTVRCLLLQHL